MRQGDTFTVRSIDDHLWVILSHPDKHPEEIVCVSVTSHTQYADHACLLAAGDHPSIKHDSYVYYEKLRMASYSWLEARKAAGQLVFSEPMQSSVLNRIINGCGRTIELTFDWTTLLVDQGLLEL